MQQQHPHTIAIDRVEHGTNQHLDYFARAQCAGKSVANVADIMQLLPPTTFEFAVSHLQILQQLGVAPRHLLALQRMSDGGHDDLQVKDRLL